MNVEKLLAVPPLPLVSRHNNTLLTIGNFDGCHLGHQQLIAQTVALAKQEKATACAMIFDPSPAHFFSKQVSAPLFTQEQKIRAFSELGIQTLFLQTFDAAFASLSDQAFYERIRDQLGLKGIVVGDDFCFGSKRSGNTKKLRGLTARDHLLFATSPCYHLSSNEKISSSHIREALEKNENLKEVEALLGRPYLVEATLKSASSASSLLLQPDTQLLPRVGAYQGQCWWGEGTQRPPVMRPNLTLPPCTLLVSASGGIEVRVDSNTLPTALPTRWGIYLRSSV